LSLTRSTRGQQVPCLRTPSRSLGLREKLSFFSERRSLPPIVYFIFQGRAPPPDGRCRLPMITLSCRLTAFGGLFVQRDSTASRADVACWLLPSRPPPPVSHSFSFFLKLSRELEDLSPRQRNPSIVRTRSSVFSLQIQDYVLVYLSSASRESLFFSDSPGHEHSLCAPFAQPQGSRPRIGRLATRRFKDSFLPAGVPLFVQFFQFGSPYGKD